MNRIFIATVAAIALSVLTLVIIGEDEQEILSEKERVERVARFESMKSQASQGNVEAQYALALIYRDGRGTEKNPKAAFRLLSPIAGKGYANAQYALGQLYEKGQGIEQNYFKAAEWYSLASNLGRHAQSQFALAQLYFNGRGVPHDYAEALTLYRKAARRGHAAAQYLMGAMYQDGWGVKSDYAEAYKWYSLALPRAAEVMAVNSSYDPARALERLKKKMKKFQISQGEKRLKEWRRSH